MPDHITEPHTPIAIVGAGPIGLELAAGLKRAGADYLHFEAQQIGHTFTWWPRNTPFFSTPERIAIAGVPIPTTDQRRITGEEYLAYLRMVVELLDLQVRTFEPVTRVEPLAGGGFRLHSRTRLGERTTRADAVIVASGGMARPRLLGIPGEDLPHVSHHFESPHTTFRQRLLVIGGRNSALETAIRCWRAGAQVALSYRGEDIDRERVKQFLWQEFDALVEHGKIAYYPGTVPTEITPEHVVLAPTGEAGDANGQRQTIPADFVLLQTGYVADMTLFREAGVTLVGEEQRPLLDEEMMETDVPGLYAAGTAAGGTQQRFELFIETSHIHVQRIVRALTGQTPVVASVPARNYNLKLEEGERPVSHR